MWRSGHSNEIFVPWAHEVPNVACRAIGIGSVIMPGKGSQQFTSLGFS
jgi:hypothetical protein